MAGFQAGCLASLTMLSWWLLGASLQRRSPWTVPNQLATLFYGDQAYGSGFTYPTLAGLALPYVVYTLFGVAFALIARDRRAALPLVGAGLLTGLALNWLFFTAAMKRMSPELYIYLPSRLLMVSHLLYGVMLATFPSFLQRLKDAETPSRLEIGRMIL
jgi:hypothetical protein